MSELTKLLIGGVISLIVAVCGATYTYHLGKSKGLEGKKAGFDQITTQVNLDKTKWEVSYEDITPLNSLADQSGTTKKGVPGKKAVPVETASPSPFSNVATVEFNQYGSRIIGEGRDNKGRKWIVEGAAAERRVCYIYFDPEGQRLSFGTVLLEMDNSGVQMVGQWTGWAPESNELHPRKVTLKKLSK